MQDEPFTDIDKALSAINLASFNGFTNDIKHAEQFLQDHPEFSELILEAEDSVGKFILLNNQSKFGRLIALQLSNDAAFVDRLITDNEDTARLMEEIPEDKNVALLNLINKHLSPGLLALSQPHPKL